jgi:acyl-coenzyme A thioesterase PaaI-like protein
MRKRIIPTRIFRRAINLWSPFRAAGIVVTHLTSDWRYAKVELRERLLNRNYVGTHFGGSLYAMTDPFYMLMLMHHLGRQFTVWDCSASIEYLIPGRGTVSAEFRLDARTIEDIRAQAARGRVVRPKFTIDIHDASNRVVARVHKEVYVRRKRDVARRRLGMSRAA